MVTPDLRPTGAGISISHLPRLHHVNVTSVVTSDTRRLRYNCIDRRDVNAVNHDSLNIYKQEVQQVIDHERNIPRITKWNVSEISHDLRENTDTSQSTIAQQP